MSGRGRSGRERGRQGLRPGGGRPARAASGGPAGRHRPARTDGADPDDDGAVLLGRTGDAAAVETALRETPLVEDVRVVDEVDGETLFGVTWSAEVNGLRGVIAETEGVVLRGTARETTDRSGCGSPTGSTSLSATGPARRRGHRSNCGRATTRPPATAAPAPGSPRSSATPRQPLQRRTTSRSRTGSRWANSPSGWVSRTRPPPGASVGGSPHCSRRRSVSSWPRRGARSGTDRPSPARVRSRTSTINKNVRSR